MAKKKFYAVKQGHQAGIFDDWTKCQDAIRGFPNADFKSFLTEEEAQAYLDDKDIYLEKIKKDINDGYVVAYTDGSFDKEVNKYAYGVIIFDLNNERHELSGAYSNQKFLESNNIAGEIFGVLSLLDWVISNNYEKVKIYYDYEGIEKWATKEWNANSEVAKTYIRILDEKNILDIKFEHVKGHSNNKYNNEADTLAKSALTSLKKNVVQGENYYLINGYSKHEIEKLLENIALEFTDVNVSYDEKKDKTICRLESKKNKLCITFFKNGKIMVQGKLNILFQIFTTYLFESNENADVVKILSDAYKKTISFKELNNSFTTLFPNLPSNYPPSMENLLKQSIINTISVVESIDYSQYVFPALRALEGHLKYLLKEVGIIVQPNNAFNMFNKNHDEIYYLTQNGSYDKDQKQNIEKCYNRLVANRKTLFHFGNIIGQADDCRIIEDYKEAKEYIIDALTTIQETI